MQMMKTPLKKHTKLMKEKRITLLALPSKENEKIIYCAKGAATKEAQKTLKR